MPLVADGQLYGLTAGAGDAPDIVAACYVGVEVDLFTVQAPPEADDRTGIVESVKV